MGAMQRIRSGFAVTVFASAAAAGGLEAQFPTDTLDVHGVVGWLRETGSAAPAKRFLSQEGQRHPLWELNELADSLVAIAVSYRSGDPLASMRLAREAQNALAVSALPGDIAERAQKLAGRGLPPPVVYPHAFDRLVEVYRRAEDAGIKGSTLWLLTQLGDTARAVAFLGDVAVSNANIASEAIRYLSMDAGTAGLALLRRLHESGAVVEPHARENLEALASIHGWKR